MIYSVTQHGKPLSEDLYTFDEENKIFSSKVGGLVLDFSDWEDVLFNTGYNATFKTGSFCTFKTAGHCTFKTGFNCTFYTGACCVFETHGECTFNTSFGCTFDTGYNCVFKTASSCTFITGRGSIIVGYGNRQRHIIDVDNYVPEDYLDMKFKIEDYKRLKEFPLENPELMVLYTKDELGMRLFKYLKEGNNV